MAEILLLRDGSRSRGVEVESGRARLFIFAARDWMDRARLRRG